MKEGVAIVGATGFIGSEITSNFKKKGITLHLCSKNGGSIQGLDVDSVDSTNERSIINWLSGKNIEVLIYLSSIIPKSFESTDWGLFDENMKMHKSVFNAWKEKKFHLIYASSCSVYSRITPHPCSEMTVVMPDNFYSISKFVGELLFY